MNHKLTFRYIFSTSLCLGLLVAGASTWAQPRYWPTGIRLSIDVASPLYYKYYQKTGVQYEFNASTDFANFMLEGDYGWGSIQWKGLDLKTSPRSAYTSDGKYFRIGLNYNLLQDTPDKNAAFLGVRYATSFFQDHLTSQVSYNSAGPIKNKLPIDSEQSDVKARWYEAVAGVKVKVWKILYVGGTVRYKFGLHIDGTDAYVPYDVLGWACMTKRLLGLTITSLCAFLLYAIHYPGVALRSSALPNQAGQLLFEIAKTVLWI